jgi:transposase-like protein
MRQAVKYTNLFNKIALSMSIVWLVLPMAIHAANSTNMRPPNAIPAQHNTALTDCYTTAEERYTVTMLDQHSAYPNCKQDYVVDKINLRTSGLVDIDTYVSVKCCKTKVIWD